MTAAQLRDVLTIVAVALTVMGTLGAALWWLIWPRIEDKLEQLAGGVRQVRDQLAPEVDGSTGAHAAAAARAAAQLPELRRIVEQLTRRQTEIDELRIPERLQLVELAQENTERRVSGVEQAVIAYLGAGVNRGRESG